MMAPIKRKVLLMLFLLVIAFTAGLGFADVNIKIVIVNPSDTETQKLPVFYNLPDGIKKEDIIDTGGLKVDYNVDQKVFYVFDEFELPPKESRTLKVVVRDIWRVPESEFSSLSGMIDEKLSSVEDPKVKDRAALIAADLKNRLDVVQKQQADLITDVEQRMQLYPINIEKINEIKEELFSLEHAPETKTDDAAAKATVVLVVEAQNTLDKEVEIPLKYYLPSELLPEYIINTGGFEVKFDPDRNQSFLERTEAFAPNEKKLFKVEVRNVWHVSPDLLARYLNEATALQQRVSESAVKDIAQALLDEVTSKANLITESQSKAESVKDRISTHKANQQNLAVIRDDLEKLRSLTIASQQQIVVSGAAQSVQTVFRKVEQVTSIKLTKVASQVVERLKKVGVWRVMSYVVGFVIVVTIFCYVVWFLDLKRQERQKLEKVEPSDDTQQ